MQLIARCRLRISLDNDDGLALGVEHAKAWAGARIEQQLEVGAGVETDLAPLRLCQALGQRLGFRRGFECSLIGDVNRHHHAIGFVL